MLHVHTGRATHTGPYSVGNTKCKGCAGRVSAGNKVVSRGFQADAWANTHWMIGTAPPPAGGKWKSIVAPETHFSMWRDMS